MLKPFIKLTPNHMTTHKLGKLFGHEVYIEIGEPHTHPRDVEGIKELATKYFAQTFTNQEMLRELKEKYPRIHEELMTKLVL